MCISYSLHCQIVKTQKFTIKGHILGESAQVQKPIIRFIMSNCTSHCTSFRSHWTDNYEIWKFGNFQKPCRENQSSVTLSQNNVRSTWRTVYIYDHLSRSVLLRM